jgi:hypothetical protein
MSKRRRLLSIAGAAVVTAVAAVVVVLLASSGGHQGPAHTAPLPRALVEWPFSHGLPGEWSRPTAEQAQARTAGPQVLFDTSRGPRDYQLLSPVENLSGGRYLAVVHAQILAGGLQLGVLEVRHQTWVAIRTFDSTRHSHGPATLAVSIRLPNPTPVRLVLANGLTTPGVSRWRLADASLRGPLSTIPTPVPHLAAPISSADFSVGVPVGWTLVAKVAPPDRAANGLTIMTSGGAHSYQALSPVQTLRSGRYVAVVEGQVLAGGMNLGVLDHRTGRFLSTSTFVPVLGSRSAQAMLLRFALRRTTPIQIILSDARSTAAPSRWAIKQISVRRATG